MVLLLLPFAIQLCLTGPVNDAESLIDFFLENQWGIDHPDEVCRYLYPRARTHSRVVQSGRTPLFAACVGGDVSIVKLLLPHAAISKRDRLVCYDGCVTSTSTGGGVSFFQGRSVVHYAAMFGRYAIVNLLIDSSRQLASLKDCQVCVCVCVCRFPAWA